MSVESNLAGLRVVEEFSVESEAELTCAMLEQIGVNAEVIANHSLGAGLDFGSRGSYRVIVRGEDLETARMALAERDEDDSGDRLIEGEPCPQCGAEAVMESRLSGREVALRKVIRMIWMFTWHRRGDFVVEPSRRCAECWHRW